MHNFINVNDLSFNEEVIKEESLTLVEFGAHWCGPCRKQLSILEIISKDFYKNLKVIKVDIDDAPLASKEYGVKSVPTLILFKGGMKLTSKVGVTSLNDLKSLINSYISDC